MTKRRNPISGLPEGRCLVYPMSKFPAADAPDLERDRDVLLRRLPPWATNPHIRRADEVGAYGEREHWWIATVEVDAPPRIARPSKETNA